MAKKKTEDAEEVTATSASVYAHNGGHVRTYTREIHGDDFESLAKDMATQHPGSRIEVH